MLKVENKKMSEVSGGAVWKVTCPICKKEVVGSAEIVRVDNTKYEHPYFCKDCAGYVNKA